MEKVLERSVAINLAAAVEGEANWWMDGCRRWIAVHTVD